MSDGVEVPTAGTTPQASKGFAARVLGVFISPGETFEDIARKPTILAPLLFLLVVVAALAYFTIPAEGKDAAKFTENSSFFQQQVPEDQRAQILEQQRNPSSTRRALTAAARPLLILVLTLVFALLYWGVGNLLGGEPTFKKVFSMLLFASMIAVAGSLIKLPLVLSKGSVAGVTFGPAMLMPELDMLSPRYQLLAMLDLFAIWGVVVTGIGFAKVSKISTAAGLITATIFYGIVSAVIYSIARIFS